MVLIIRISMKGFLLCFFLCLPVFSEAANANCGVSDKSLCEAAEQGDVKAQIRLGAMYSLGDGVKQDDYQSFQWYKKAAEQGDYFAQYMTGANYSVGKGVSQDKSLAREWFGKSCNNGWEPACREYSK